MKLSNVWMTERDLFLLYFGHIQYKFTPFHCRERSIYVSWTCLTFLIPTVLAHQWQPKCYKNVISQRGLRKVNSVFQPLFQAGCRLWCVHCTLTATHLTPVYACKPTRRLSGSLGCFIKQVRMNIPASAVPCLSHCAIKYMENVFRNKYYS